MSESSKEDARRTVRRSRRQAERRHKEAKGKRKTRQSIGDALGVRSKAKGKNPSEAKALASAKAAAASLEKRKARKKPRARKSKKQRSTLRRRTEGNDPRMRAQTEALFSSDPEEKDDDPMPGLDSDEEKYEDSSDGGSISDDDSVGEAPAAAAPKAKKGRHVSPIVDPRTGKISTPGKPEEPTEEDEEFLRGDDSDLSYEVIHHTDLIRGVWA